MNVDSPSCADNRRRLEVQVLEGVFHVFDEYALVCASSPLAFHSDFAAQTYDYGVCVREFLTTVKCE